MDDSIEKMLPNIKFIQSIGIKKKDPEYVLEQSFSSTCAPRLPLRAFRAIKAPQNRPILEFFTKTFPQDRFKNTLI